MRGIGKKGAAQLVTQFESLEDVYANLDKVPKARMKTALENNKENAFLSHKLFLLQYHPSWLTKKDMDWIGIYSTHLNSHLLRIIFSDVAYPKIIDDYEKLEKNIKEPIVLGAGGKPGSSTDYDAVLLAQFYKVEKVINLSNIKMVYDKDPNKFSKAQPIKEISWSDFRKLSTKKWTPGLKVPFDPVAAQLAEKLGLKVVVCNGKNLKNLKDILEEKEFVGTIIK